VLVGWLRVVGGWVGEWVNAVVVRRVLGGLLGDEYSHDDTYIIPI